MNESIKDRFLKEHALNDDDLEKVNGGVLIQQKDGTYFCTCCGKTVDRVHSCCQINYNN